MIKETTGDRIRSLRKAKGLTLSALADSAEISKGFMHDLENDRRTMGGSTLLRVSRALGAGMEFLLTGTDDKRIEKIRNWRMSDDAGLEIVEYLKNNQ